MKLVFSLAVALMFFAPLAFGTEKPKAKPDCAYCAELKKVEGQMRDKKMPKEDLDSLQLVATALIQKMTAENPHINEQEVSAIVSIFDASIARDPAKAIAINNVDVVNDNRAAFDKEIAKLPSARAKEVKSAIEMAIGLTKPTTGFDDK